MTNLTWLKCICNSSSADANHSFQGIIEYFYVILYQAFPWSIRFMNLRLEYWLQANYSQSKYKLVVINYVNMYYGRTWSKCCTIFDQRTVCMIASNQLEETSLFSWFFLACIDKCNTKQSALRSGRDYTAAKLRYYLKHSVSIVL